MLRGTFICRCICNRNKMSNFDYLIQLTVSALASNITFRLLFKPLHLTLCLAALPAPPGRHDGTRNQAAHLRQEAAAGKMRHLHHLPADGHQQGGLPAGHDHLRPAPAGLRHQILRQPRGHLLQQRQRGRVRRLQPVLWLKKPRPSLPGAPPLCFDARQPSTAVSTTSKASRLWMTSWRH